MEVSPLVHLNASLNALATVLLFVGYVLIKRKRVTAHRNVMIATFVVSALFLASYLTHKAIHREVLPYHGQGVAKTVYLLILFSHMILAAVVPVFAILLIRWGLKGQIAKHKRLAVIAWPIWMYVSITGVIVYLMLVWFNPTPG